MYQISYRRRWTVKEKLRLVRETNGMTLRAAREAHGVSTSVLCSWRNNVDKLQERMDNNKENTPCRLKGGGRPSLISAATQQELLQYLDIERELTNKVDVPLLLVKLRQIDPFIDQQIHDSNGSLAVRANIRKQVWRILHNNNVAVRRTTHQAQITRHDHAMMNGFTSYIKEKMKILMIDHDCIANFDETNLHFCPLTTTTLDRKGHRTVAVKTPMSGNRCTVMIGVTGDGHPFPPFIIFKGKHGPTGRIYNNFQRMHAENDHDTFGDYPTRCFYSVQKKGWMDSILMLEWIKYVWKPWTDAKNGPTILILDEFAGHMTAEVREAIKKCGTHLEFIPGGYTSQLQVMDVGFNKPFKDQFRHQFVHYCRTHNMVPPKRENVATWIQLSWEGLSVQRIATNTWRRIGLPRPITIEGNDGNLIEANVDGEAIMEMDIEEDNIDEVVDDEMDTEEDNTNEVVDDEEE